MAPPRDTKTKSLVCFAVAAVASIAVLAGCPQERPGAEREIPLQRIPPAVAVDPQPAIQGVPVTADGGAARRP